MPSPPTRTLSAKQVADDVRAGMDDLALKQKYSLSDAHLQSVLRKLMDRRVLTESEVLDRGRRPIHRSAAVPPMRPQQEWRCPACDTTQTESFDECPICGVVVSKIRNLNRNEPALAPSWDTSNAKKPARGSRWWVPVAVSVFLFVLVGGLFLQWAMHRGSSTSGTPRASRSPTDSGTLKKFTSANFNSEVVEVSRTVPVLVEFYADW